MEIPVCLLPSHRLWVKAMPYTSRTSLLERFKDERWQGHEFRFPNPTSANFNGREYTDSMTYLTITQENKKSRLMSFDNKKMARFPGKNQKGAETNEEGCNKLDRTGSTEASVYVDRFFAMNFRDKMVSMTGFKVDDEMIGG